jgi:hypothetical protein
MGAQRVKDGEIVGLDTADLIRRHDNISRRLIRDEMYGEAV